jgi:hypothetical protein
MKISILIVVCCLIASTYAVVPACVAANYCRGCSETIATNCTRCHNWHMGTIGAKFLTNNACVNSLSPIKGCKIYKDTLTLAPTANVAGSCVMCDKDMPIVETSANNVVSVTCAKTRPTACAKIDNCHQQKCETSDAGVTYTSTCISCEKEKGASAYNACAGTIPVNCEKASWFSGAAKCLYASKGYAVDSTFVTPVAYTTDSACQALVVGSTTQCSICWDGYYWDTTFCKLSAKLIGAAFLFIVGLFIN